MVNLSSVMSGVAGGAVVSIVIRATDEFSSAMNSAQSSLTKLASVGKIALIGLASGMAAFGASSIKAASDYEVTKKSFEVMLGSAEKGQKMLKDLAAFTKETPFQLTELETSARMLMGMGIEADKILPTMKSLGDVAAGLGVDFDRLALNFGQVKSQGVLMGTELRDFSRAGVPIIKELADMLGVAETEIKNMGSEGKITFDMVEEAFKRMTSEGGTFANLMKEQMGTARGQMSNLSDEILQVKRDIGDEMLPAFKEVVSTIADNKDAIIAFGKATATVFVGMINGISFVIHKAQELGDMLAFNIKILEAYTKLDFETAERLTAKKDQYQALRKEGMSPDEALRLSGVEGMTAKEIVEAQKERIESEKQTTNATDLSTNSIFNNINALDVGTQAKTDETKATVEVTQGLTVLGKNLVNFSNAFLNVGMSSQNGESYSLTGASAKAMHQKLSAQAQARANPKSTFTGNYEERSSEATYNPVTGTFRAASELKDSGRNMAIVNNFYNQVNARILAQDFGNQIVGA